MAFHDRQHEDALWFDAVDDPVGAEEDLADVRLAHLGNHTTCEGGSRRLARGFDEPVHPGFGSVGVITSDIERDGFEIGLGGGRKINAWGIFRIFSFTRAATSSSERWGPFAALSRPALTLALTNSW